MKLNLESSLSASSPARPLPRIHLRKRPSSKRENLTTVDSTFLAGIFADIEESPRPVKKLKSRKSLSNLASLSRGSMWRRGELTWRISQYTPDMSVEDVDNEVRRAFQVWSSVTNLNFRQLGSNSRDRLDIDIGFLPRVHGDGFDFDGQGGTLAHAFFPEFGGDVHMDEAERWTFNTFQGVNLFQVIAHEFGHSLGLEHSSIQEALMAPFYRGYQPNFQLHQDDINGIQRLYGVRINMETPAPTPTPAVPPTPPPLPPVDPSIKPTPAPTPAPSIPPTPPPLPPVDPGMEPMPCQDGRVDSIFMTEDQVVYVFRGNYYMVLDDYGIIRGYPRKISDDWNGLPNQVDAAITFDAQYGYVYNWSTRRYSRQMLLKERIYFFKANLAYLFQSDGVRWKMVEGYPKPIQAEFPGLPNDIDAAFRWSRNNKPYFMKGGEYYRYSTGRIQRAPNGGFEETPGMVDGNYPRDLRVWKGLPGSVDAAFVWKNGRTYFFAGDQYYRFNDRYLRVDRQYPRPTRGVWFGCASQIKDGQQQTTMMMEANMQTDSMIEVVDGSTDPESNSIEGDGTTSNQPPVKPVSQLTLALFSLLLALVAWL